MIPLDSPTIDSLSLSIEKKNIHIIDKNICSQIQVYYYDTKEFDDQLQSPKPFTYTCDGITIRLKFIHLIQSDGTTKEYLNITLSSKLLKQRYFQGLNKWNIQYAFFELMNLRVFKCSLDDFRNGLVSDVDICINYNISQEAFIRTNHKIISLARVGFSRFFNWFLKKKKNSNLIINLGLDINTRVKAKPSTPYLKHYFKTIELTTKSYDFYNAFLKDELEKQRVSINDLARIEYTIKGYRHKDRLVKRKFLKERFNTLNELLDIPADSFKKIIYSGFEDYIVIPEKLQSETDIKGMTPMDVLVLEYQKRIIELGGSEEDLFKPLTHFEGKQKSRLKSKINSVYTHLKTNNLSIENQAEKNAEINSFFDRLKKS